MRAVSGSVRVASNSASGWNKRSGGTPVLLNSSYPRRASSTFSRDIAHQVPADVMAFGKERAEDLSSFSRSAGSRLDGSVTEPLTPRQAERARGRPDVAVTALEVLLGLRLSG